MFVHQLCTVPKRARRGWQVAWNWTCRCFWVLWTKPRSSARVASNFLTVGLPLEPLSLEFYIMTRWVKVWRHLSHDLIWGRLQKIQIMIFIACNKNFIYFICRTANARPHMYQTSAISQATSADPTVLCFADWAVSSFLAPLQLRTKPHVKTSWHLDIYFY